MRYGDLQVEAPRGKFLSETQRIQARSNACAQNRYQFRSHGTSLEQQSFAQDEYQQALNSFIMFL